MKHTFILIALCCISFLATAQDAEDNAQKGEYIVQLHSGVNADSFIHRYPYTHLYECLSHSMNIWRVTSLITTYLPKFQSDPSVRIAQYNHNNVQRRSLIPNDTYFSAQWNMLNTSHIGADIDATDAWQVNHSAVTQTGDTIVIAVIDGTFDIYHEDLNFFVNKNEIPNNGRDDDGNGYIDDYHGWNVFMNNDSVYDLLDNHGTHVAGIAAAIGDNNKGVAGVCWGAKILAVDGSSTLESDVVKAYDYVIEMRRLYDQTSGAKGAFIVATNSSFGVDRGQPVDYPVWCALYDSMGHYGILSACATANNNYNIDQVGDIPTTCPSRWMIAVTNTTQTDIRNPGAAYGAANVDIGAPGTNIESTYPGNSYGGLTGTSMSTPHIAGAIAAMIANACPRLIQDYFAYPDSIALILRDYMFGSVDPLSTLAHVTTSGGRLNLYHAYQAENAYNCNDCHYTLGLSQQSLVCHGDSNGIIAAQTATTSGGYHYLWSTGDSVSQITNLKSGFYQLTVTDSTGCQRTATTYLTQPSPIHVSGITIVPLTGGSPGNVIFTASAGNDTLYYAMDNGSFQTSDIFVVDSPGVHHFRIRNAQGCEIDTTAGIFYTGIQEESSISYFALSPNPASGMAGLTIRSDRSLSANINLTDITGRLVYQQPLQIDRGLQRKPIDISGLAEGVYVLSILSDGHTLTSIRVSVIR